MNSFYKNLLEPTAHLAEKKSSYASITERHIQAIWLEQKYFKDLKTLDGLPIKVISPGIWNAEAGPDFLKAHLIIGDKEIKGDVEIHFTDQNWYQHNHHNDSRYDKVVLHLALWKSVKQIAITTKKNENVIQTYLEDSLTISLGRITQLIDIDLYPYKKFIGSGKCAQLLFSNLAEDKCKRLFQDAAHWRLTSKADLIKKRCESQDLTFPSAFAMALGYKNNSLAFFELFQFLKHNLHLTEDQIISVGMKVFGFLKTKYDKKWNESNKFQELKKHIGELNINMVQIDLALNQIRPLNHPIRRIVYLAKFIKSGDYLRVYNQLVDVWDNNWKEKTKSKKFLLLKLLEMIPNYKDEYWNSHYLFESQKDEHIPLIGEDFKREIIVNAFFPLLYEKIINKGDWEEINAFHTLYSNLPAGKSGKSRYLIHRFFGDTPKGLVLNKLDTEQGAFQLHHDFCIHYEASCDGCPFVERYLNKA